MFGAILTFLCLCVCMWDCLPVSQRGRKWAGGGRHRPTLPVYCGWSGTLTPFSWFLMDFKSGEKTHSWAPNKLISILTSHQPALSLFCFLPRSLSISSFFLIPSCFFYFSFYIRTPCMRLHEKVIEQNNLKDEMLLHWSVKLSWVHISCRVFHSSCTCMTHEGA